MNNQPTAPDMFHPNEVRIWIDEQLKAKRFRPCGHLVMGSITRGHHISQETVYLPRCLRNCFAWKDMSLIDQGTQTQFLTAGRWDLISCPKNCKFYRSKWVSRFVGFVPATWRWVKSELNPIFEWYAKLYGGTQMLVILLLILLLAPKWVPKIVELVKAMSGK